MTRTYIPTRRPNVTKRVAFTSYTGKVEHLLITVGFGVDRQPAEVFCANWKTGSDMHALVTDACIALSMLMQYGAHPRDILRSMCEPPSLLGALAKAAADEWFDLPPNEDTAPTPGPDGPHLLRQGEGALIDA
jgi:hypothetical protein